MTRILVPKDCGNSPRRAFISDFYHVLSNTELNILETMLNENFILNLVGKQLIKGRMNALMHWEQDPLKQAIEIKIDSIITHGKEAAASGTYILKTGTVHFCDYFEFKQNKGFDLIEINRYLIQE